MKRFVPIAVAALAFAACSMTRVAYNNGDVALRFMADDYLDLRGEQERVFRVRLARFHQWHRSEELPVYSRLFEEAGSRVERGLQREDVIWALEAVRARYRILVVEATEGAAPVLATLTPENFASLEKKFADSNAKFAKEYVEGDQVKRDRARTKRLEERFATFMGDLTDEQTALVARFVRAQPQAGAMRLEDRKRRQRRFIELLREYGASPDLNAQLGSYFINWERDRDAEGARFAHEWEERLITLILDMDKTMTPEQRARVVQRFSGYADDFQVLAAQARTAGAAQAVVVDSR